MIPDLELSGYGFLYFLELRVLDEAFLRFENLVGFERRKNSHFRNSSDMMTFSGSFILAKQVSVHFIVSELASARALRILLSKKLEEIAIGAAAKQLPRFFVIFFLFTNIAFALCLLPLSFFLSITQLFSFFLLQINNSHFHCFKHFTTPLKLYRPP